MPPAGSRARCGPRMTHAGRHPPSDVVGLIQTMRQVARFRCGGTSRALQERAASQPAGLDARRCNDAMKETRAIRAREIARAVLRYLETHPEAKDTLEGIARWWLERERSERLLEDVERAVALLLSSDLVLETRRHGMPPYYQINPSRRQAVTKITEEP
jgi:hypothetical protein